MNKQLIRKATARVRAALDLVHGTEQRVRLFYGDVNTGKAWNEEHDVMGTVGKSTGRAPVLLLIPTRRSMGGGAILDRCIVGIQASPALWLYRHKSLDLGQWDVGLAVSDGFLEASYRDSGLVGQFKKPGQARRHCDYMEGNRWSK